MKPKKHIDIAEAAKMLKNELSLFDESEFEYPYEESLLFDLSEEAQYIAQNYRSVGTNEYDTPVYQDDETEIMAALAQTLPKEEREQLTSVIDYSPLQWRITQSLRDYPNTGKQQEKQPSISTLLRHFCNGVKGKKVPARTGLRNRFDYQSFADQVKILRAFLQGTRSDREWCYRKLLQWWDDEITPDLEQAWLDYQDEKCVKTAARRLPEEFIKKHQKAMGKLDYKSVCRRLAHDEGFKIDKSRLTPTDYCYVIAHNHRHISDQEADRVLFGQVKYMLDNRSYLMPFEFKTHFGREVGERMEDRLRYRPSLLFFRSVGYVVWALGQTGNAATIIKFHRWNKMLQDNMPQYLAKEKSREDMLAFMNEDFRAYQQWNWRVFTEHAFNTISDYFSGDDAEFLQEDSIRYRPDVNLNDTTSPEVIDENLEKFMKGDFPF